MTWDEFTHELTGLLNASGADTQAGTPDYLLAEYLTGCLRSYVALKRANEDWHREAPATTESEAPPSHFRQPSLPLINYITPPGPDLRPYTVAPTESEAP